MSQTNVTAVAPARPRTNKQAPSGEGEGLRRLPLSLLTRHPDNRAPTAAQIAALVESIERDGQLEPIVVRPIPAPLVTAKNLLGQTFLAKQTVYQIISGETRALAQAQRREETIEARVIEADDARALELLATFNAARADLNPIQKARLIDRLCQPTTAGGGGLTREQAGAIYGFHSASAASNLVRLLELPPTIAKLVESGALPQTFARECLPFGGVPAIVKEIPPLVAKWKDDPPSRHDWVHDLRCLVNKHTRTMRPAHKITNAYQLEYAKERLFEPTADTLAQLVIVTLPMFRDEEQRATNVKLWEQLQAAERKKLGQQLSSKAGRAAAKGAAKDAAAAKQTKTPAEQRALEKEQDASLAKRIRVWRHEWLKSLIAATLRTKVPDHWVLTKIVLWRLTEHWTFHVENNLKLSETLDDVCRAGKRRDGAITQDHATWANLREMVCRAIETPEANPDYLSWPFGFIDELARDLKIDIAERWRLAQPAALQSDDGRLAAFFALHNGRQLRHVAAELKIHAADNDSRAELLKRICHVAHVLPLPAALKPQR